MRKWSAVPLALAIALIGCEAEQEAGEGDIGMEEPIEQTGEDVGGAVGEAGEETGEAMGDVGEAVGEAAGDIAGAFEAGFEEIDANADASVDETEFGDWWTQNNVFGTLDTNGDMVVTQEEFNTTVSQQPFGGELNEGMFTEWDADQSGDLNEEEVRMGFFDLVDENDNQMVEQNEWDRLSGGAGM